MKKRRKKYIVIILTCMLLILQVMPVYAEENSDVEWYEMVEEEFDTNDMIRVSKGTPMRTLKISYKTTNSCQEMV